MSGFAFTKPYQMVNSRPTALMSASQARGGESAITYPFTSTAAAEDGEIAVLCLGDAAEHWVTSGEAPTPGAGTGVPVQGPGTFHFTVKPGDKVAVHKV